VFSVEARRKYCGKSRFFEEAALLIKTDMDNMQLRFCLPDNEKAAKNDA
jgi:hypothetical protein